MTSKAAPVDRRLAQQFEFLDAAGGLKNIVRSNCLLDTSRQENTAEHSWHLALYALIFAEDAPAGTDIDLAIRMLLLHDIVEVDAGDHPIFEDHDPAEIAAREAEAATRLFGLLPPEQRVDFHSTWNDFEAMGTPTARYAKMLDFIQPVLQVTCAPDPIDWHLDVARDTLIDGRARLLHQNWPDLWAQAAARLPKPAAALPDDEAMAQRLAFLNTADALKTVARATPIGPAARPENSGEHSWHIALYALVLADQAGPGVTISRVVRMLLIHDLVEIDAGDAPIHGDHDVAAQEALEQAAATRIFGLLPLLQGTGLRALWDEFEAATTPDAIFAKAIDRVQPLLLNLASGGGSWVAYNVTLEQLDQRIGTKVARGAPAVWAHVRAQIKPWFDRQAAGIDHDGSNAR